MESERRVVDGPWRELMAFEIDRARALYRSADLGVAMKQALAAKRRRKRRR